MVLQPGSRKDRFDELTMLALRKNFKVWDQEFENQRSDSKDLSQKQKTRSYSSEGIKCYPYEKVKEVRTDSG